MKINEIGYFQFENLLRNRVPFVLLNIEVQLDNFFESQVQKHLESVEIKSTVTSAIEDLKNKKIDKSYAIILLCKTGEISAGLVSDVEALGYVNVYSIHRGQQGLVEEK